MGKRTSDPMLAPLATFRDPLRCDWESAWIGMEPTFQSKKSVRKWSSMSGKGEKGEDAYFEDRYMLGMQEDVAKRIQKRYQTRRDAGLPLAMFHRVVREVERDQWDVQRQNLEFHWKGDAGEPLKVRFTLDPETFEYSIKPVPLAWFYDERFAAFLEEIIWKAPLKLGLTPSIAHGGCQFSFSAKTYMTGSLLADDIADKLNHPELSTFVMDWPNPDDRAFRATRPRMAAFRRIVEQYRAGAFHPKAIGRLTPRDMYLDRGFGPAPSPPGMPAKVDAHDAFLMNFAFGRAVRLQAQNVDPGYWQSAHPDEEGYRPDQIMRYSEGNLNRLQIAGELHVKSGEVLGADRIPKADEPLRQEMLHEEASWEARAQMGRTSARDFIEAMLLDAHHARWLQAHPRPRLVGSLLQDQLMSHGEETLARRDPRRLLRLKKAAAADALDASRGRVRCDEVEPETLAWETWKVLPAGDRAAIAREIVAAFHQRVHRAASVDPRPASETSDPMEWHRHRVHPVIWKALEGCRLRASDPVARELAAFRRGRATYLARRPVFSQDPRNRPPWGG